MKKIISHSIWHSKAAALADKVIAKAKELDKLSQEELVEMTNTLKEKIQKANDEKKALDENLVQAFAMAYVATQRVMNITPYKVQLIAGVVLHNGEIAEQKTGEGKANPATLKIPTPFGWRKVGDIKVGDYLFDRYGKPTKVTGVFPQGKKQIYDVNLVDGRTVPAADEHLWSVYENQSKRLRTLTTAEMYAKNMRLPNGKSYRFRIPVNGAAEYEPQNLPIDPYVLGAFLGNGCKEKNRHLELSSGNDFVPTEIARILGAQAFKAPSNNYTWTFRRVDGSLVHSYDITNLQWMQELLSSTLSGDRYIPEMYRIGSVEQRWALLQGLFDTDGCIEANDRFHLTYWTTSELLRDHVCEVVRSLGLNCSWRVFRKAGTRTAKADQYCININVPNDVKQQFFRYPFKLDRAKAAAAAKPKRRDFSRVAIDNIVLQDKETEMICFTVDNPEHLFLIGDYVVTHNTLTAVMPSFLHALAGKGVHVVTVNPYLAQRDADNIGRVHEYLGLTVGCVAGEQSLVEKQQAYACDVTYVSNTELGFDYLRDNMANSLRSVTQRGLHYAIVDEVDSILIDEARTPLIIAGPGKDVTLLYERGNAVVSRMEKGSESAEFNRGEAFLGIERKEYGDYIVHEKKKNVILTLSGVKKVEDAFGIKNYAAKENRAIQHVIEQSLYAHALMKRGKDYIVKDGDIALVDEFTGRVSEGRQYADGLHQAIQAKEHVAVSAVNETVGTTTYQNFFRKYELLSGMTGTAWTQRDEFFSTYGLKVRQIETNKPMIREDKPDVLFVTKEAKWNNVAAIVVGAVKQGRPVLVGTASVAESEAMSKILTDKGIKHQVLNAKQDAAEAEIIAQAGVHGTVTVATNMAGRGTDIILDDEAKAAGGLLVIGTEKHESERIDNQLRGRAGRQGDPGTSVFYCSTEDRVMRLYGSDRYKKLLEKLDMVDDKPVDIPSIMKGIKATQKKVEEDNFAVRRDTLEYDDVNDMQRERIYKERRRILAKENVEADFVACVNRFVDAAAVMFKNVELVDAIAELTHGAVKIEGAAEISKKSFVAVLKSKIIEEVNKADFPDDDAKQAYIRRCMLIAVDSAWAEHLKALEFCRDAVAYAGYGQLDPKAVYAHEAYKLYEKMQKNIYASAVFSFFLNRVGSKQTLKTKEGKLKLKSGKNMEV